MFSIHIVRAWNSVLNVGCVVLSIELLLISTYVGDKGPKKPLVTDTTKNTKKLVFFHAT